MWAMRRWMTSSLFPPSLNSYWLHFSFSAVSLKVRQLEIVRCLSSSSAIARLVDRFEDIARYDAILVTVS